MLAMMPEYKEKIIKPRNRKSRGAVPITYRLMPKVISAVKYIAEKSNRSDNQQAEILIKVGFLQVLGIDISGLNELDILRKFDDATKVLPTEEDKD